MTKSRTQALSSFWESAYSWLQLHIQLSCKQLSFCKTAQLISSDGTIANHQDHVTLQHCA